jgi:hypothetical protein
MSFGYSIGDFLQLTQLAYTVVQNARKACGAVDSLTREVSSLHIVLQRLESEVSKEESLLNRSEDNRKNELATLAKDCQRVLRVLSQILEKYNALSEEKRSVTKLWQRVRFGNGEMQDLGKIRSELATYTQAMTLFLNLLSIGSQGKVEAYMDSHGEELREIKHSLHWVTASMQASSHEEKSILTSYAEDDKAVWKAFRRELIKEGVSSRLLEKHKKTIKRYVMELGERGILDEMVQEEAEMNLESCDISTIQESNPHLGEGPDAEATVSKEAPTMSSTESEDIVHLDDVDQETIKISLDANFVSKSKSFADESSSTNSSTILLSDVANNGKTAKAEVLRDSSPSVPADGRAYSNDFKYKKGGRNAHEKYGGQYMQAAGRRYEPAHPDVLNKSEPFADRQTRQYSSGMDSSLQDDSDAPPPPEDAPLAEGDLADHTIADDMDKEQELLSKCNITELTHSTSIPTSPTRARYQAYVENVMDEDFAVGAHPNCIHPEDMGHEFTMEHWNSRVRKWGLPKFGPSTKLGFVWYPGRKYKPSWSDSSSSIRSRQQRLGSYSDKSAYSSDDSGSPSNQFKHLDGSEEEKTSSIHPKKCSEGSTDIEVQEDEPDSDADDEESRASNEQEAGQPSTRRGMNESSRWHSGIDVSEDSGERSRASLLQAQHYQLLAVPDSPYPPGHDFWRDSNRLDLELPGVHGGNWNPILKEENRALVTQPYFAPGSLKALYSHRRYQSSIAGSVASAQRRRDLSIFQLIEENQERGKKVRLDFPRSQLNDSESDSDISSKGADISCYYGVARILLWRAIVVMTWREEQRTTIVKHWTLASLVYDEKQ